VSEQTQPSCRDKKSGWWLAGPASDFVVRDMCCIWNTQDIAEAPLAKSINSQILTFWDLLYQPPFINENQIWCAIADAYVPNFISIEKPQFLSFFGLRHLVVLPVGITLRKLNTAAQLQTIPYPSASKSFLYFNAFTAKSSAQSLTFKSVTNKQTNKKENSTFLPPPRQRLKYEPHQTWRGDRGRRARSCTSKTFGV